MEIVIGVFVFLYGISIGSFLNVVIYRLPLGLNMNNERSICPKCKNPIKFYDLIPIFSWVALKGKCRYCKEKISLQYPFIELLTGIVFLLTFLQMGISVTFFRLITLFAILIVISVIDINEQNIYDITTYTGIALTLVFIFIDYFMNKIPFTTYLVSAGVNFLLYFLIHIVSFKMYDREVFGMGDVLLAILIGLNIPLNFIYFTVFLPFIVALFSTVLIFIYCKAKKREFESLIPFGPFMAISCFILTLYGTQIPFIQNLIF